MMNSMGRKEKRDRLSISGSPGCQVLIGCPTWRRVRTQAAVLLLAGLVVFGADLCPASGFDMETEKQESAHAATAWMETGTVASDTALRRIIQEAFAYDERLISAPRIHVSGGNVTLTGSVESHAAKRAAEEDAAETAGPGRVKNLIHVRSRNAAGDETVAVRVNAALSRSPYVRPNQIHVSVTDGIVSLTGHVDSYFERLRAEYAVFPVQGVSDVVNHLEVVSGIESNGR